VITIDFDLLRRIDPAGLAGARVLDVGCGSGRHTAEAYRLPAAEIVGVDLSVGDLAGAAERMALHHNLGQHGGGSWYLAAADATCLPFGDECFDLVICSEVLEHVFEEALAWKELLRVLKAGKLLALSVPRCFPERICWGLSREYRHTEGGHVRIYRKTQILEKLQAAGADPLRVDYAHSLHTPYWWLKCLVGPGRQDHALVNLYHRLLVWDMMARPRLTRRLQRMLDPLIGKSLVVYARKLSAP
jgi:ubiquinone/menaquinone biosynthesis C-methylase UbiE